MCDDNLNSVDLTQIDWNKLSPEEFSKVESELQRQNKILKANQPKPERLGGYVIVKIQNNQYRIKMVLYQRLKTMKSGKSKQKLIDEIISSHQPIEKL